MHTHSHSHDYPNHNEHHGHHHGHVSSSSRLLLIGLLLTLSFALVEAIGGWWSGSLALLGDAGHMFSVFDANRSEVVHGRSAHDAKTAE